MLEVPTAESIDYVLGEMFPPETLLAKFGLQDAEVHYLPDEKLVLIKAKKSNAAYFDPDHYVDGEALVTALNVLVSSLAKTAFLRDTHA